MSNSPDSSPVAGNGRNPRSGSARAGRGRSVVPIALATIATLVLGGASMARAVEAPPLDAHSDLEFSLDGSSWSDAPDLVLGSWGCDLSDEPRIPDPAGAINGTPGVDPCSMSPGESVDRTYFVRNSTDSGRVGRYEVGVGDFVVSEEAEFAVTSTIIGAATADSRSVMLYGADTPQADDSPERGTMIAGLDLAPGQSAKVVDEVAVPRDPQTYVQRQSVSPRMWVSFTDQGVIDRDGDGLPDLVENQLGTDPDDPLNNLPEGTVWQRYGPEPFLPTLPDGATFQIDESTLPDGMRLEGGILTGRPTRSGTYDVAFTVTMPDGATYQSIRRVVVNAGGGGSSELPDFFWPIIAIGVIGAILGPVAGSLMGSLGDAGSGGSSGSSGSSGPGSGGSSGSSGPASGPAVPGSTSSSDGSGSSASPGSGGDQGDGDRETPSRNGDDGGESAVADPGGASGDKTGQVLVDSVTPREGTPSQEWARANSDVRGSLASTGVTAIDLLLWALTASMAGVLLILLAKRRRHDDPAAESTG